MELIKVAVVGLGFMGRTHIQTLRRLGIEVYGVAGIDKAEAQKVAADLGIPKWYANFDEALADPAIGCPPLYTQPPAFPSGESSLNRRKTCSV